MTNQHPQHHIDRLLGRATNCRIVDERDDDDDLARQDRAGTESQEVGGDDDYA